MCEAAWWGTNGLGREGQRCRSEMASLISTPVERVSTLTELLMLSYITIKGAERPCWNWHAKMAVSAGALKSS